MFELDRGRRHGVVPGAVVLWRVWMHGHRLGAIGGVVFGWLWLGGAVVWTERDQMPALLMMVLFLSPAVGAPVGLLVGAAVAPVAALLLLVCRRFTELASTVMTVVTLTGLWLVAAVLLDGVADGAAALACLVCAIAGWPMHRALSDAPLPSGRPA